VKVVRGICALFLLSVLAGQAFVQTAKPLLLETGDTFIPEDVKAKDGETWLGLYVTKSGSSLIESKVSVKSVAGGQASVSVDKPDKPVFLVKGAAGLKPGLATTIYRGVDADRHVLVDINNLASRKPKQLKLGAQEYQLKVLVQKAPSTKLQLELVSGEQNQIIYTPKAVAGTAAWYLLWAGDADGDGKLDLYVELDREDTNEKKLFLSSQAKAGQFVNEAANFIAN
jgi:hypothetical protein